MSGQWKTRLQRVVLGLSLISCAALVARSTSGQQSSSSAASAMQAEALLRQHCFHCHGQNGQAARNIFVLDRARLVAARVVIPGDAGSPLLKAVESGAMPLGGSGLTATEMATLRQWVLSGAPDWSANEVGHTTAPSHKLTEPELMALVGNDLEKASESARPFLRYLSLAHLQRAGVPEDELESHRLGLAKLINSLSWQREITPPTAIDAARTLWRIDLRDYGWTTATWQKILAAYPYGLLTPETERVARLSGELLPYVRADWLVAVASVPPLYHDILGLPATASELERRLGVETARHLSEERNVLRAGVRASGVSQNNRVLERHTAPFGAYWRSYDFRSNLGAQNIFAEPLRLNAAGGEIIFNLPNGLQGYLLLDALGRRIDTAPVEIVADRQQPNDPIIRNGRSCISCHTAGMRLFQDDVRPALLKLKAVPFDLEKALALYAAPDTLERALAEDTERFRQAVARLGGRQPNQEPGGALTEPVNMLARRFQAELPLALAAAEVGLKPRALQERLRWNARLHALGLGQLLAPNGGLQREVWEKHFGDVARELQLGAHLSGPQLVTRAAALRSGVRQTALLSVLRPLPVGARPLPSASPAQGNAADLLQAARTIFVRSDTVYLRPEQLETALRQHADFLALDVALVKDQQAADLVINLNRPLFTFDFTYSVTHRASSLLVASGKVTAFDGTAAAPKIAAELSKQMQAVRAAQ